MSARLSTVATRAAVAVVAAVAGWASYSHIVKVATRAGESDGVPYALPLTADGLILVGTLAMIEDRRAGRRPHWSARGAVILGIVGTLAANLASAQPNPTAYAVAAWPAVAFLLAVEVLLRPTGSADEPAAEDVEQGPVVAEETPVEAVAEAPVRAVDGVPVAYAIPTVDLPVPAANGAVVAYANGHDHRASGARQSAPTSAPSGAPSATGGARQSAPPTTPRRTPTARQPHTTATKRRTPEQRRAAIVAHLDAHPDDGAYAIAEAIGESARTVSRDLSALRDDRDDE